VTSLGSQSARRRRRLQPHYKNVTCELNYSSGDVGERILAQGSNLSLCSINNNGCDMRDRIACCIDVSAREFGLMNPVKSGRSAARGCSYRALLRVLCCASALSGVWVSGTAAAADVANATILEIAIDPGYGNHVFIRLNKLQPAIGCAPGGYWQYTLAFSSTGPSQQMYAALLAAQMAGKTISVTGAGACNENPAVESMRGMNVQS